MYREKQSRRALGSNSPQWVLNPKPARPAEPSTSSGALAE